MPREAAGLAASNPGYGRTVSLGADTQLVVAGIGPDSARAAVERLLACGVNALVSWGSAGALTAHLAPGTLALPAYVIDDVDGRRYDVDAAWHARLLRVLSEPLSLTTAALVQSRALAADARHKQMLRTRHGADTVDMESAAIAAMAERYRLPFVAVRAVADHASQTLPGSVAGAVDEHGRLRLTRLLGGLLRRPADCVALAALAVNFRAAQNTLANVVAHTGVTLCADVRAAGAPAS